MYGGLQSTPHDGSAQLSIPAMAPSRHVVSVPDTIDFKPER